MRPRAELVEGGVLEKHFGSLPAIADFCRRIDIAGIIDELCPIRNVALATHGQVIEVLIANRLTNPIRDGRDLRWGAGVGGAGGLRDRYVRAR